MKRFKIFTVSLVLIMLGSCGGPDLIVINQIHTDGSVSRKVITTYHADEFDLSDCQVPIDSTWAIEKNLTVSEKGDSIWTLTAEKIFGSVDEINEDYDNYGGTNGRMNRFSEFRREFRWFSTNYYFSETVLKAIDGYPPEDFFSEEELDIFYMPQELIDKKLAGSDSLKYITIVDSFDKREELWLLSSLVRAAIIGVVRSDSIHHSAELEEEFLFSKEKELVALLNDMDEDEAIDSIFGEGFYKRNQVVFDTTFAILEKDFDVAFSADAYVIQTNMPGELVATNGYIDDDGNMVWAVNGNVFLSNDYVMWAESTIRNLWAWIVTVVFLLFVITGFIIRFKRNKQKR
ncbi:MAG: hypothetical protein K8R35_05895 [Bacteroidales bacterium]|nr:hypothetical protein [Bacteroidales bacterium]